MVKVIIDGQETEVPEETTILQAARLLGIEIPIFCYHERLSIAGNCRMCLVEVEGSSKPVASCAMPVSPQMVVHTSTEMARTSRQGALEFLLINHPLDCPICDQGGECDLQDITMAYGRDRSRFSFYKRTVVDKNLGPLIKTSMNRCIHCTRCVRFSTEVAGVPEMGAIHRGEHTEITSYLEKSLTSELSGNMIDLCPVGALTSKPYAYRGRPWELVHTETIDVMDAVGSAIRVDTRGPEVMRVLPLPNEAVNEEWISDKTRFSCDGLKVQRLDRPYVRNRKGILQEASWEEAFSHIENHLKKLSGNQIAGIVGDLMDVEAMSIFQDILNALGTPHIDCRQDGAKLSIDSRSHYIFNTTIEGLEKTDFVLIIGSNPREEAPVLNARLRKNYVTTGLEVGVIGPEVDLTYPATFYENSPLVLSEILSGKHPLSKKLKNAKNPALIIGQGALRRKDGAGILKTCALIAEKFGVIQTDWCGFNVLHLAASRVGGLDLGLVPGKGGKDVAGILKACKTGEIKALFLLGADELALEKMGETFLIYQGHHGERSAAMADVILPGAAYTEKQGLYVNTEGRVQRAYQAAPPPGQAKEDRWVLMGIAKALEIKLPYKTFEELAAYLVEKNPLFKSEGLSPTPWVPFSSEIKEQLLEEAFLPAFSNFYMTDVISRHSKVMAACTQSREESQTTSQRIGSQKS
jgi:NADH-quinone oxidoreductase subunit G